MATVADVVKKAMFFNFRAAWFLLDRVYNILPIIILDPVS
jgi:hypothetical protein